MTNTRHHHVPQHKAVSQHNCMQSSAKQPGVSRGHSCSWKNIRNKHRVLKRKNRVKNQDSHWGRCWPSTSSNNGTVPDNQSFHQYNVRQPDAIPHNNIPGHTVWHGQTSQQSTKQYSGKGPQLSHTHVYPKRIQNGYHQSWHGIQGAGGWNPRSGIQHHHTEWTCTNHRAVHTHSERPCTKLLQLTPFHQSTETDGDPSHVQLSVLAEHFPTWQWGIQYDVPQVYSDG